MSTNTLNSPARALSQPRAVERLVAGQATSDGAGVKLTRVLTQNLQRRLDPFLMLDAFGSDKADDYIAGFPDHPHRGFETVTYMLEGRMRHRDSAGHEGLLGNGGVQWMTAGRGVIHSELPEQEEGRMEGFQLWLNLPARDKMREPWYRDIQSQEIPEFRTEAGVQVRVIAGEYAGTRGPARSFSPMNVLDVRLAAGQTLALPQPEGWSTLVVARRGTVQVNGDAILRATEMATLSTAGTGLTLEANNDAELLVLAGEPIDEPVVGYGPFVMNSQQQIVDAVNDFNSGRFGQGLN